MRDPTKIREWLVAISVNEARQLARRAQRRQVREIPVDGSDPVAGDPADEIDLMDESDSGADWALSGWCEGAGAYEGSAPSSAGTPPPTPCGVWWDVHGFITSGDGPPMPEPPAR